MAIQSFLCLHGDSGEPMKTNLRLEDGRIGEQPEVIYHVFHTMLFGALAMVFEGYVPKRFRFTCYNLSDMKTNGCHCSHVVFSRRMKYLWTPYVCMFTAFGVCSPELWVTLFRWLRLKSIHPVVLVRGIFHSIVSNHHNLYALSVDLPPSPYS